MGNAVTGCGVQGIDTSVLPNCPSAPAFRYIAARCRHGNYHVGGAPDNAPDRQRFARRQSTRRWDRGCPLKKRSPPGTVIFLSSCWDWYGVFYPSATRSGLAALLSSQKIKTGIHPAASRSGLGRRVRRRLTRCDEAIAGTGRDETIARSNKPVGLTWRNEAVTRRDKAFAWPAEAIRLSGRGKTMIARAGCDEAFARGDKCPAPGYCVVVIVIGTGRRRVAAPAGLRVRPQ